MIIGGITKTEDFEVYIKKLFDNQKDIVKIVRAHVNIWTSKNFYQISFDFNTVH